jgi:CTP synthase
MIKKRHKFIFVIGGVMSGVGKGVATSSIAKILDSRGIKVNIVKVDPYLNVDAGTMNPTEHGECFVLRSGLETDQDMGNYERFLGRDAHTEDYMTSGMVYLSVIERERALGYGGKCVEAMPHIRDEIINRWYKSAEVHKSDVSVVEIGGTVGDYQNIMFIEAARVLKVHNPEDVLFVLVSYMPIPEKLGEMKSKPTQNAVRQLNAYGVNPDLIIARATVPLDKRRREKVAVSCSVKPEHVISAPDIDSIYEVPLNLERDNIGHTLMKLLKLRKRNESDLKQWAAFVRKAVNKDAPRVKIAVIGKYFDTGDFVLSDAYISVIEAIKFSAFHLNVRPELTWINSKEYEDGKRLVSELSDYHGVVVPGGFGSTGVEGILEAIRFVRENHIPYLGLCYGMQLAVVEYARTVAGIPAAHTTEVHKKTPHPVIDIMSEQKEKIRLGNMGGTMRLGVYPAYLQAGTRARELYGTELVEERHRHRFEVNPAYVEQLEKAGLVFSAVSPDKRLMEMIELPKKSHPFFMASQFHPELQARPLAPHPLFTGFIKASKARM